MFLRDNVTLSGIPYRWCTNLDDDGIREFYFRYADDIKLRPPPESESPYMIWIPLRLNYYQFREGFCFWMASNERQTVIYRTAFEWDVWNARQEEIAELRQEQAAEEEVEKLLVITEDAHLREKTDAAKDIGDFEMAAAYVTARAQLRERFEGFRVMPVEWNCWYPEMILAKFPKSDYGIDFFTRFRSLPQSFTNFGHWFSVKCGLTGEALVEETWKIYEAGMRLFPESGGIAKAASLFFRRVRRFDRAIAICADAITRGLQDGTKSGFEGRLKRLEKESKNPRLTK
jgi:hypothetical protein